jgi:hypothetical protein
MDGGPAGWRVCRLLVAARGLSGALYPVGTEVRVTGHGSSVDGFVGSDWIPLSWWEYSEGVEEPGPGLPGLE